MATYIVKPAYASRSLDKAKQEIRIVHLLPGRRGEAIACELHIVSLAEYGWDEYVLANYYHEGPFEGSARDYEEARHQHSLPERTCEGRMHAWRFQDTVTTNLDVPHCGSIPCECFEALSYTWGDFTEGRSITLAGLTDFSVTNNLFAVLQRLRRPDAIRRMWIDAICINQDDLEERVQQVGLMGELYSKASEVRVWLGDTLVEGCHGDDDAALIVPIDDQKKLQLYHSAFGDMLNRTSPYWWDRAWVIQELVMARHTPKLQLGPHELEIVELIHTLNKAPNYVCRRRTPYISIGRVIARLFNNLRVSSDARSILDILFVMGETDCHDPRDKVYSTLGIIRRVEANVITVDYSERTSASDVFTRATYAQIEADRNLRALTFIRPHARRTSDLPSWVLDFGDRTVNEIAPLHKIVSWTQKHSQIHALTSLDGSNLHFRGLALDQVRDAVQLSGSIGVKSGYFTLDGESTAKVLNMLRELPHHDPYCLLAAGERQRSNCIRGCVGDLDWSRLLDSAEAQLDNSPFYWALERRPNALFKVWDETLQLFNRGEIPEARIVQFDYAEASFFITEYGFLGLGYNSICRGDNIVLPYGSSVPAVLSKQAQRDWAFHGVALVYGITGGELNVVGPDIVLTEHEYVLC